MKRHLTQQELIEYRFDLASEAQAREASAHLDACEQCRDELETLKRKFKSLDLLHGDVAASEELISQVIEQVAQPRRLRLKVSKKLLVPWGPVWAGAAAAALVIGLLWITADSLRQPGSGKPFAGGLSERTPVSPPRAGGLAMLHDDKGPMAKADAAIPEKPPFAPASAIELVTLPRRDNVQLTIYNLADLTLVRETRNLTLKKGWNWLQFMWANTLIDPTSLSLEPKEQGDKIDIQQLVFPARLRELGRWLIRSEVSGQVPFEITYFTSGLSWRAFYMGTLAPDEETMQMKGYVRIANASGEEYENAQTRLVVGNVHILDKIAELAKRRYPYGSPIPEGGGHGGMIQDVRYALPPALPQDVEFNSLYLNGTESLSLGERPKEITKEGLSEYFLYTIEGTETIPDQWGKRLLSFEADDIKVDSLYKYDEERWGGQTRRFVKFANDEEHNLGDTPIPDGEVRIYGQADEDGSLSYVGGTSVKYIPVNEEVELDLGPARLVKIEPKLMDFKTENYRFDNRGNVAGWDEIRTWNIEIANTRNLPVEIEITRGFATPAWDLDMQSDGVDHEKHDATHARFELKLNPQTKRNVEYIVTTYHGTRTENR